MPVPPDLVTAVREFGLKIAAPANDDMVARNVDIEFNFDGGGDVIAIGSHCYAKLDLPCRITGWYVMTDISGSMTFDLNIGAFVDFPTMLPVVGTGGVVPNVASARSGSGEPADLVGWTIDIPRGSVLEAVVTN